MPKLDCRTARPLFDAVIDGEITPAIRADVEAHLATCPACAGLFAEQGMLVARVRKGASRHMPPVGLAERLRASIPTDKLVLPFRVPWWHRAAWAGSAAALAASLFLMVTGPGSLPVEHELVSAHTRSLMADHLLDVESSDRHTVKPWFNGRVTISPPVPDLAVEGFALLGGRLDLLGNQAAAALVYRRREHRINLFIWPAADADMANTDTANTSTRNGFNILQWQQNGIKYAAISDLNRAELFEFRRLWLTQSDTQPDQASPQPYPR